MIFKVKWGDFEPLLNRKHIGENETISPIFYYESDIEITMYQANSGYIISTSLAKEFIENLESFKLEFLSQAIELPERPKENNTLVIKQE